MPLNPLLPLVHYNTPQVPRMSDQLKIYSPCVFNPFCSLICLKLWKLFDHMGNGEIMQNNSMLAMVLDKEGFYHRTY